MNNSDKEHQIVNIGHGEELTMPKQLQWNLKAWEMLLCDISQENSGLRLVQNK